ncbi:hypothetical protein [Taibaiella soli]|uniref:Uncharacterized protein n=1 Tax=Taibaiella soli TaxID=1649169 RepID=A0A2W2AE69_9BACT|nr:hypothetical protein [Taibaiella soli]PZF71852.1 hypothetical protein DN068_17505 [Taibaiella soli]
MNTWIRCVEERKEALLQKWRNAPVFTSLIKSNNDSVLKHVGDKLGLKSYANDYYFLDGLLYDKFDLVPGIPENQYWFRQIRVAFEHENYFKSGLYKEVAHLLLINSDLKVLVTYPDYEMHEEPTKTEMKYLHEIIQGTHNQKMLSDSESFLIFGSEANFG